MGKYGVHAIFESSPSRAWKINKFGTGKTKVARCRYWFERSWISLAAEPFKHVARTERSFTSALRTISLFSSSSRSAIDGPPLAGSWLRLIWSCLKNVNRGLRREIYSVLSRFFDDWSIHHSTTEMQNSWTRRGTKAARLCWSPVKFPAFLLLIKDPNYSALIPRLNQSDRSFPWGKYLCVESKTKIIRRSERLLWIISVVKWIFFLETLHKLANKSFSDISYNC